MYQTLDSCRPRRAFSLNTLLTTGAYTALAGVARNILASSSSDVSSLRRTSPACAGHVDSSNSKLEPLIESDPIGQLYTQHSARDTYPALSKQIHCFVLSQLLTQSDSPGRVSRALVRLFTFEIILWKVFFFFFHFSFWFFVNFIYHCVVLFVISYVVSREWNMIHPVNLKSIVQCPACESNDR